jgi:hypothetical protein
MSTGQNKVAKRRYIRRSTFPKSTPIWAGGGVGDAQRGAEALPSRLIFDGQEDRSLLSRSSSMNTLFVMLAAVTVSFKPAAKSNPGR